MTRAEFKRLDNVMARLQDCDLSAWDQDFVDDMVRRIERAEAQDAEDRFRITARQWEQVQRLKDQYL